MRLFIGQKLSLEFLIPLALQRLAEDPLVEGTYFPADLLINVAESGNEFLGAHLALLEVFVPILERGIGMMENLEYYDRDIVEDRLGAALERYKQMLRDSGQ